MKLFLLVVLSYATLAVAQEASLSKINGKALVNNKPATQGMPLNVGDRVTAIGKGTSVEILFQDKTRMLLRNGELEIKKPTAPKQTLIQLIRGVLFSSKEKSDRHLKVQTTYASMGVRGTKFYVDQQEKETYLCVCEGSVEIANGVSTAFVHKNEDAHVSLGKKFEKSQANPMMIDMALDGFKEMGLIK